MNVVPSIKERLRTELLCEYCGIEAPTRRTSFVYNVGMFFLRQEVNVPGLFCKKCAHRYYWKFNLINLGLGWWGAISMILTPAFVVANTLRYLGCMSMPQVPREAKVPELFREEYLRAKERAVQMVKELDEG